MFLKSAFVVVKTKFGLYVQPKYFNGITMWTTANFSVPGDVQNVLQRKK